MATVYRARDSSLDRLVALKVLHPHLQRTSEARARFTREAKSVAKLRHPHILEIYDYSGEGSDETYIAAELLTGPTLKDFVTEKKELPPEVAACIALQLADALGEAHAKGIIHRDVKPENVLIHEDRCVKLTDFGIAHMLGTVLYFCATGRLPFVGRNPHHLLKLLLSGEYPDPLRLQPVIGADLAAIMNKALSRQPVDRYQTATEMAESLREFLSDMGVDDPDDTFARYLVDSDGVTEELRARSLERLLDKGARAASKGDVPAAQAALSRALAIDDGNERALKLLASIGKRQRRGALLASVLAGLAVLVAGFFGYYAWSTRPTAAEDAAADVVQLPSVAVPPAAVDAEPERPEAEPEREPEPEPEPSGAAEPEKVEGTVASGPRWVVFKPTPPNVSISIDGGPLRAYGPGFLKTRVKPGAHTFRFVGAEDCCEDRVVRRRIPPGARDYELAVKLKYRPARLYLKGPAPADARVQITLPGGRKMRGRIREILRIPMSSLNASAQVVIRAPGYRTHEGVVDLRAGGELTEHSFALERESETP
jgi:serine/threonine-protein kinase